MQAAVSTPVTMLQTTTLQPAPIMKSAVPHATQGPPYSPTLINLNQKYNMSANSLTEALLLLSGMYISLVQPEPGPAKVSLHAIFPRIGGSDFMSALSQPFAGRNRFETYKKYSALQTSFNVSSHFTRSDYAPRQVLTMLCEDVFPRNSISILYINNHLSLGGYQRPTVTYLPKVIESLGLPIISYDTEFSPNSRTELSVQLAPTMGQMMDVMFAFLRRFGWTDFSFLCTLSTGCEDQISYIRLKVEESNRKTNLSVFGVEMYTYRLLSYVNFTNGNNETEVREKLTYELHKDSRINLIHGQGSEVKGILDVAKQLGLTEKDYLWIFTASSITLGAKYVDDSYPLGSFIIGYNSSREAMSSVIADGINLWLTALDNTAKSPDMDRMDFNTGFSCERLKEEMSGQTGNNSYKSPLYWKYGELFYKHIIQTKLKGDLEFDEYGVLKSNIFYILNVQAVRGTTTPSKSSTTDTKASPGISESARQSEGLRQPLPTRNEQNFRSKANEDIKESNSPTFGKNEPSSPDTIDRASGTPSSRNRDSDSPFSRNRESESPFSRDRNGSSPFSHDRQRGSPFSGNRDRVTGSSVDNERMSPFSRDRDRGFPSSKDKVTNSPFSFGRDGHSQFAKSDTFESDDIRNDDPHKSNKAHEQGQDAFSDDQKLDLDLESDPNFKSRVHYKKNSEIPQESYDDQKLKSLNFKNRRSQAAAHLNHKNLPYQNSDGNSDKLSLKKSSFHETAKIDHSRFSNSDSVLSSKSYNRDRIRKRGKSMLREDRGQYFDRINRKENSRNNSTHQKEHLKRRSPRDAGRKQVAVKVGDWDGHQLLMYDMTWPGGSSVPPKGKPEKYILKVVTWQEDPHVIYRDMKPAEKADDKLCEANSVPCTVYNRDKSLQRTNGTKEMCCTGMCIDLLIRIGEKLNFDVNITEVADGSYGSPLNPNLTDWNGMLGMLIRKEADLAIGALSITPERSTAVEFSVPFLQTGITIIVALRHGAISAIAFLEPYDYPSWSLILLFSVHATGASIFIFEWLSPYGLNQGKTSYSVHKFSLFRSFWLIWAMLFGASVSTDQPRGMASRFLANIWALFAVVFCASYTANLAAFMITKDTYYDIKGMSDWRLRNPHHIKPPFKFATIENSSTDILIKKNFIDIHTYMKNEAQTDVKEAIKNLKAGNIQAFIYDSTTLEYEVGKDDGCKLKTVGKRIAETGYGVAFPKRSQWVKEVDKALLQLQESGEIERLQKHWLARACHNKKETGVSSHTLGILNFTSAFVLLGSGIVLGVLILLLEHMYFRFGRKSLKKWDKCGCCSLVSLSMGQSLTFEQSVMEAIDYHKHHRCRDPLCETQLWKVKHDLDIALLKISQLRRQIASSVPYEVAMGGADDEASSKSDRKYSPNQNGSARRRRQQSSDASSDKMQFAANQPLLALEGKSETDEDNTPVQSPKHVPRPSSNRSSYPITKNKANGKRSNRYSNPDHDILEGEPRRSSGDYPMSKMSSEQRNMHPENEKHKMSEFNFHPPPPSFDEAMTRYGASLGELDTPSPPPPPAEPSPPDHSPQGGMSMMSDSNASNSSPSTDEKRYEPFILDSPESPSFSSFSETSENRLSCPGTLSKLSDEIPSTAVSQDMDSNFASSPEMSKSLEEANNLPNVGHAAASQLTNAQNKHLVPPIASLLPLNLQENSKSDQQNLLLNTSKEADNDVNTRRTRDNDGNIYVNVDEISGRETSF